MNAISERMQAKMTATFQHDDVTFIYPENWEVTKQPEQESPWDVALEIPGGGFWSLHVFPNDTDPDALLANAQSALSEQYEDVEFQTPTRVDLPSPTISMEAYFYCLDFLVTALMQIISTPQHTYFILCQAESREFDENRDVFQAILTSLLKDAHSIQ